MTELELVFQMDSSDVAVMDNASARKYERRQELFRELDNLMRRPHSQTDMKDWVKAREIVQTLFRSQ